MTIKAKYHLIWRTLLLCLSLSGMPAWLQANADALDGIAELPPGEQYRQLSLLLLLAQGADAELLDYLGNGSTANLASISDQSQALQQYPTPLARIADPESMLQGAGQMMRFAQENRGVIEQELTEIAQRWPVLVSMIDMNGIREDAIIIRSAVTDSLQYPSSESIAKPMSLPESSLLAYQGETIHQRNTMEYLLFRNDLDVITDSAIGDLGYKLDAYQRMTDEEIDPELLKERIDAAENMNEEARQRFQEQAYIRASTLYLMLIPALVTVATE